MTTGSPAKLILGFAIPMLMGLLFQQFYSMVDTIIVGKFLGVDAWLPLAPQPLSTYDQWLCNRCMHRILYSGCSAVRRQDYKDMRRFVANAGWLASFSLWL